MHSLRLLIVDDEPDSIALLKIMMERQGYEVTTTTSGAFALELFKSEESFDVVITDLIMSGVSGLDLLAEAIEKHPDTETIIMTAYGSIETAVTAMRQGAYAYFIKGNDPEELLLDLERIEQMKRLKRENQSFRALASGNKEYLMASKSPIFQKALDHARKVAATDVSVLLLGESGVGKEVFAEYIHSCSQRKDQIFMPINSYAFSDSLLESELFGHEKGAFTGSTECRVGRFEAADSGTLFLDEIGDLPLSTQVKILRTLETKRLTRIGSNREIQSDFRLISATNRDLKSAIEVKSFREDLNYRISTMVIRIPPLRERPEDLPLLIDHFLQITQKRMNKTIDRISDVLMKKLMSYHYPGNVRELKNIMERLVVLSDRGILTDHGFFDSQPTDLSLKSVREEAERRHIAILLGRHNGDMRAVAEILEISLRQLYNKVRDYHLK